MRVFEYIALALMVALVIYFAVSLYYGFNNPYSVSTSLGG